jgi:mono/diheme cytochrome c family protein
MGKIVIFIVIMIGLFFLFIFSGLYNVSARKHDPAFVDWILGTVSEHSIERYSKSEKILKMPATNDMTLSIGNTFYADNCTLCHGGPGVQRSNIGKGLNPVPPDLEKSSDVPLKEIYWIINNGIKMTGMPSFGITTKDSTVWACAYFVTRMMRSNKETDSDEKE